MDNPYRVEKTKNAAGTQDRFVVLFGKEQVLVNTFLCKEVAEDIACLLNEMNAKRKEKVQ